MVQLGSVNFDRNPETYLHLFNSNNGAKLERRKFVSGLIDILENPNKNRENGDVTLSERIIDVEYLGIKHRVLVARKGRFIEFDGKYIGREDTEVQGVIFNGDERSQQYATKDNMKFDVSIRQPIPSDNSFRKSIEREVYLRGLASKEKGEKVCFW
ncbi:hypothetical protein HYX17_05080 [Candidatus Woesearchaeota archaeon]|nr:hypothetical protein [Candidatus Woesearchaeota archaeon]